jgi:hypothetical protein
VRGEQLASIGWGCLQFRKTFRPCPDEHSLGRLGLPGESTVCHPQGYLSSGLVAFAPFTTRRHLSYMEENWDWETARLRRMTADEKVRVAQTLWRDVWNAAAAGVRARHPDWPEAQVQDAVRELMRDASGS